jgi:SHS2 domain-containing protein
VNIARLLCSGQSAMAFPAAVSRWEHFEYGSDIGVRGFGLTKSDAFEQVALAITAVVTDPASVTIHEAVPIWCEAEDETLLLAAWVHAIVDEMACRCMLFGNFHVELGEGRLTATACGEHRCEMCDPPERQINRATYTALRLCPTLDGGWMAQAVINA